MWLLHFYCYIQKSVVLSQTIDHVLCALQVSCDLCTELAANNRWVCDETTLIFEVSSACTCGNNYLLSSRKKIESQTWNSPSGMSWFMTMRKRHFKLQTIAALVTSVDI